MAKRSEDSRDDPDGAGFSRRSLLGGVGKAVAAGGVVLAAGGAVIAPDLATAAPNDAIANGALGAAVVEFLARIDQNGANLVSYGYITAAAGLSDAQLFSDPANHNEGTALFTAYASGSLTGRAVDSNVHALDIVGSLSVYQRTAPGATFTDPTSFEQGTLVATYSLDLQDILTVIAPNTGLPTLTGDMQQSRAGAVQGSSRTFGRPKLRLSFFATGIGNRSEPTAPMASLTVAGNFTVADNGH